jgi:hypothetical protein
MHALSEILTSADNGKFVRVGSITDKPNMPKKENKCAECNNFSTSTCERIIDVLCIVNFITELNESMSGGMEAIITIFLRKCNSNINEISWMTHTSFAIMRPFLHKVSAIFNTLLLTLSKTLYTTVV